jgi:stage III sporulation protein AA
VIDEIVNEYKIKKHTYNFAPSCGKTTLLRDIARQLSNGVHRLNFKGVRVSIVDERSEIGGVFKGIPQNDIGIQTDILDACPKATGIMLLLRCMSPQVIITDELGLPEDIDAICSANNTGVVVIASVHGDSITEISKKIC